MGYCGKESQLFTVLTDFHNFICFLERWCIPGTLAWFSPLHMWFLCLCRDMAHDTFSYEYPSYRIFFIRCMVGMLECTSDWYIFYSSYPARLSASSLTLQRAYDNTLNEIHTIPMIRIHTSKTSFLCTSDWYKDIELTLLHRPDLIFPSMYRSLVGSFETVHIRHGIRRHEVSSPVSPCYWRYLSWYPRLFQ